LSDQGHVVLPADGCCEVDPHATDGSAYRAEGGGRALCPD
jgi:hypothetical protein